MPANLATRLGLTVPNTSLFASYLHRCLLCESIFRAMTGCVNIKSRHDTGAVSLKIPWLKDHADKLVATVIKFEIQCHVVAI